jgi:hypothetical protein
MDLRSAGAGINGPSGQGKADGRADLVIPSGEQTQHAYGIRRAGRLSQHLAVHHNDRVRAEDRTPGIVPGHGLCFFAREPQRVLQRLLAGKQVFIDVGGMNLKAEAGLAQQFLPPRR